ncbi:hypothetical protein [Rathayibacter soli]|uniref:hypothetical protein n=1 Tax=Rathayibacter soli TaxID=3144168 RepID=UPI0027E5455A|nr:hypothetical protein [Glaciibacter superstes]
MALTVILGGALGYGCYWLGVWALTTQWWLAWTVFIVGILLTLTVIAGATGTLRDPKRQGEAHD